MSASTGLDVGPARTVELAALAGLAGGSLPSAPDAASLAREHAAGNVRLLVARREGRPVGFVSATRAADLLEVSWLAVAPAQRRRGIGRALLDALVGTEAGLSALRLDVRAGDARARAFYEATGFVAVGRRSRYYRDGEDAILMTRTLGAAPPATLATQAGVAELSAPCREVLEVVGNRPEPGGIRLSLALPEGWPEPAPGQFVMLHLSEAGAWSGSAPPPPRHDPLLPRPMAAYRCAPRDGRRVLEVLYKVVGRGTALLRGLAPGDRLPVVGPLGVPFPPPAAGETALLVGGGTGIASLFGLARSLAARGAPLRVLLGARSRDDLMARADFEALDVPLALASDDGSVGTHGLVTALLEGALAETPRARVYACGPTPMMVAVAGLAEAAGAPCWLSLENRMACGFGICLGCAVQSRGEALHLVCRDGPVFEAAHLDLGALP